MKGPFLEVVSNGTRSEVTLDQPRVTVGRHAANNVVVNDTRASRAHCVIEQSEDGGFQIRDLQSANGTWVNGQRIDTAMLNPGDVVSIGQTTIKYMVSNEDEPELLTEANLRAYLERCTARPAFRRALDAQLGDFREAA